jgi:hypothetical protein
VPSRQRGSTLSPSTGAATRSVDDNYPHFDFMAMEKALGLPGFPGHLDNYVLSKRVG